MIYIIQDNRHRIKIGYSKSEKGARNRLYAMKTGNPYGLKLKQVFDGTMADEHALHRLFDRYLVSGEWFASVNNSDFLSPLCLPISPPGQLIQLGFF